MTTLPFAATVTGVGRIGPNRELKRALESYWKKQSTADELVATARELSDDVVRQLTSRGIEQVGFNPLSFYDAVLDVTAILGLLPERVRDVADTEVAGAPAWLDRYFTAARGATGIPASAMTKFFDTNYHYIVPELSKDSTVAVDAEAIVAEVTRLANNGDVIRPAFIGPVTFVALSRSTDGSDTFDALEKIVDGYDELIAAVATTGVSTIQFDEPWLVTDIATETRSAEAVLAAATETYTRLAAAASKAGLSLVVSTYYGDGDKAVNALQGTGVSAIGIDVVTGRTDERAAGKTTDADLVPSWNGTTPLLVGVVDGRNVWRTDIERALATVESLAQRGPVAVTTSSSLLHVPYTLAGEGSLDNDAELKSWLAFAYEKAAEVTAIARLLNGTATDADTALKQEAAAALATRADSPRVHNAQVRDRGQAVTDADRRRGSLADRKAAQQERLGLPLLPTTTIGSFPQTDEIRRVRSQLKKGEITEQDYRAAIGEEIATCIRIQEELGLDVLVHGEAERNDMVQYFSEQLEGYHSTDNGWVQSYGSRCVRPPILFGDVHRPAPMTVDWYSLAQSHTNKPVKGMLTGPVTMLAWSFVRDDQPLGVTADQVALALRDEIDDLVAAGAVVIQVDEPAIRELLPLNEEDRPRYLEWSVGSFRLATAGVEDDIQIHTHMCYSEFNQLIHTIGDLDADVTSIEASRNGMNILAALKTKGFAAGVGPGVWDIHSPRVPDRAEVDQLIADALDSVNPDQLWINPDCGLKTRHWEETKASLEILVAAAKAARENL